MMLYMLEWYNGLEFDDADVTLIGVYTSAEAREAAKARYEATTMEYAPFCLHRKHRQEGRWIGSEIEADADLVPVFPGHETRHPADED